MSTTSNKALQGLKLAFNILREFTDPAYEGNPYDAKRRETNFNANQANTNKGFFFISKRMAIKRSV